MSTNKRMTDRQNSISAAHKVLNLKSPVVTDSDRLFARAILASNCGNDTLEQAHNCYTQWAALALVKLDLPMMHFNASSWAKRIFELEPKPKSIYWLNKSIDHFDEFLDKSYEHRDVLSIYKELIKLSKKFHRNFVI